MIIIRVKVVGLSVLGIRIVLCSSEERGLNAAMGNGVLGIIGRCR